MIIKSTNNELQHEPIHTIMPRWQYFMFPVDANRHVSILREIDDVLRLDLNRGSSHPQLSAQVTLASQIGIIRPLIIFYVQTSGNDISVFGMNEDAIRRW